MDEVEGAELESLELELCIELELDPLDLVPTGVGVVVEQGLQLPG